MTILLLFSLLNPFAAHARNDLSIPFKTTEAFEFQSVHDNIFLGIGKSSGYQGLITRVETNNQISRHVDLYEFKSTNKVQFDLNSCSNLSEKIFGPANDRTLTTKTSEMLTSPSKGKLCFSALRDPDKNAKIKEKYLILFMLKLRTFGLVFRFDKPATQSDVEDLLSFVEKLR